MDLNLIRTFLFVYDLKSLTKAADALGISQPAVSAALKRLEDSIQNKLFVKQGRTIAPTLTAERLVQEFRSAIETIENAIADQNELYAYCSEAILHIVGDLDGVTFRLPPQEESQLFEHLRAQKIDLVIDIVTTKDRAFIIEELYAEPFKLVCRRDHPRIKGSITEEQYYQEGHIAFSGQRHGLKAFELLAKYPVATRLDKVEVSSISGLAMMAASTDYLALLSASFTDKWAEVLGLQVMEPPIEFHPLRYQLIYHKRFVNDPRHKAIREKVKNGIAKNIP